MSDLETPSDSVLKKQLSTVFGGYRAEWLGGMLFDLFAAPDYLPELLTSRPCFLVGGRGTGKTTVLRGLSYEGQSALSSDSAPRTWDYYGVYYRVNTNRVAAFQGPELSALDWQRVFSHYVNLTLCEELIRFVRWYAVEEEMVSPSLSAIELVADSFQLPAVNDLEELGSETKRARVRFEAFINNVADGNPPPLSLLGQPIDLLVEGLRDSEFADKQFFFLIDEYENFSDYQQEIVNTLIKHSGDSYTFKVGVRDLGLRRRSTLRAHEQLISPADYERIDIASHLQGAQFAEFAQRVCDDRLARVTAPGWTGTDVQAALPGLSEEAEAIALGIESHLRELREALRSESSDEEITAFDAMRPLEAYLVGFWSRAQSKSLHATLSEALADRQAWSRRLDNYQYAMLFTLRRRKRGIHKYYCGWDTFTHLAAGNIRYLLQLVSESLLTGAERAESFSGRVTFEDQTRAAREVGRRNLTELEGLAVDGAQLTRLVLGLGRVFQVMARQAEGHTPEVNQFSLAGREYTLDPQDEADDDGTEVRRILTSAVMHQALVRSPANKLPGSSGHTQENAYWLHPIFSSFFEFSHRRKRRLTLTPDEIVGLIEHPRPTITSILRDTNRDPSEELTDQLLLFAPYFDAAS